MPALSKDQQAAAAIAKHAGEPGATKPKGAAKEMAKSMSKEQLGHFANTKTKNLPKKKTKIESFENKLESALFT